MEYVDLLVQRRALIGSPAVVSSIILSSNVFNFGSATSFRFRPPPGFRIRPESRNLRLLNSFMPFIIVGRDIPVNSFMAFKPPRPNDRASLATYHRDWDSFKVFRNLREKL